MNSAQTKSEDRKLQALKSSLLGAEADNGSISSHEGFIESIDGALVGLSVRRLPLKIYQSLRDSSQKKLAISKIYTKINKELSQLKDCHEREKNIAALSVLDNLGVGEVVFVAPEAQHARAGGLAQYISGLSSALVGAGNSVTVISPLYELAQGNKHDSAKNIIANGLPFEGQNLPLDFLGTVEVDVGPTFKSGTSKVVRKSRKLPVEVYQATKGLFRMILLRNEEAFSKLYDQKDDAESLTLAVAMSRGAIEAMRRPDFFINPDIVLSNDWVTALIPAYLALDKSYTEDEVLKNVKTIHIIHNCGAGYQGKFFANRFGEDLWPILGFDNQHYFGMADPNNNDFLNMTAAGLCHVKDAIIAVSRPYSVQLLSEEGGEGLQHLFQSKQHMLYGISNGLSTTDVQNYYWEFAEKLRELRGQDKLVESFNESLFLRQLPQYKLISKSKVQKENGLNQRADAILVSFVGRLTEQKGIGLLTNPFGRKKTTVLENLLASNPKVQILVAGPLSPGEEMGLAFAAEIKSLIKKFPGRVHAIFDFVSHQRALEFTLASDLMMMPSRYEPGGITQLEALAAGTPLVARNVGGIAATLVDNEHDVSTGNSFLFESFTSEALQDKLLDAVEFIQSKKLIRPLLRRMLRAANDWSERVPMYVTIFQHINGVLKECQNVPYLSKRRHDLEMLRPSLSRSAKGLPKRNFRYLIRARN